MGRNTPEYMLEGGIPYLGDLFKTGFMCMACNNACGVVLE